MKTFKLKILKIVRQQGKEFVYKNISLLDGLIINREDEQNRWLIEAHINKEYFDFFTQLYNENKDVMAQVKITKETNDPALFLTSIVGINEIDDSSMNVLLLGTILDDRQQVIEDLLTSLMSEGYQGKELIEQFKQSYSNS